MATALTTIFGDEIYHVGDQPRQSDKQYVGFPGADGLVGMDMGFRGKQIVITGCLRESGDNYAAARVALRATILEIEEYQKFEAADYSYFNDTYENVVFDRLQIVPDKENQLYHWNGSEIFCYFICYARQLT